METATKSMDSAQDSTHDRSPEQERQRKNEIEQRKRFLEGRQSKTDVAHARGRGSQTDGGRGVRYHLVPCVADWLQNHDDYLAGKPNYAGYAVSQYRKIKTWVDPETIAHIGVSCVLDSLGRGSSLRCKIVEVQKKIGEQLEHQAFIAYMETVDPLYLRRLTDIYLNDPVRRYDKKVYAMQRALDKHEQMSWQWMSEEDQIVIGSLVLHAVMSVEIDPETGEGFFEKIDPQWDDNRLQKKKNKKHRNPHYLGFTKTGLYYRDKIQEECDLGVWKPMPMVCKPLPWGVTDEGKILRGGYILPVPGSAGQLVHGTQAGVKSTPSQMVCDAVNRLQSTGYRINTYILDLMQELMQKTHVIGSWSSYEKLSYDDEHKPMFDSDWLDSLDKESKEYKDAMRALTDFYHNQKIEEKKSATPRRTVLLAEEFRNEPAIYTPWFLCSRGRAYPVVEGLSPQGTDAQKSLLRSAVGIPINEDTERDLLISIATAGAFEKVDKRDFFTRFEWAYTFVRSEECKAMVEDPITWKKWHDADEPWQFLVFCKEWYDLFHYKNKTECDVFAFRDATNSGLQILGGLTRDEKSARMTNVLVTEEPQDAYQLVADTAKDLMRSKSWMDSEFERREKDRVRQNKKRDKDKQVEKRGSVFEFDIDRLNRNHTKKQVMTTLYNSAVLTRREGILEALKKKDEIVLHPGDRNIVSRACIEAMEREFSLALELNQWFQSVAAATIDAGKERLEWITPSGMHVVNEYREPLFTQVSTYCAGGGSYAKLQRDDNSRAYLQTGWGDVKRSKIMSSTSANYIHSLDSAIIHLGVLDLEEGLPFFSVHDCLAAVPGTLSKVVPVFRKAFHNVVTSNPLVGLLEENDLLGVLEPPEQGDADIDQCLESPYMFC